MGWPLTSWCSARGTSGRTAAPRTRPAALRGLRARRGHAMGLSRNLGGLVVSGRSRTRTRGSFATEATRKDDEESETFLLPVKRGNSPRGTPWRKGRDRRDGTAGGKDDGGLDPRYRLHETPADSGTGEDVAADGASHPRSPHRRDVLDRSIRAHPEGWSEGRRRYVSRGLREEPGSESPVARGPAEVRDVPSSTRSARAYPQGRRVEDAAHWHTDVRGQGPPTSGGHGAGGRLRAGLLGLLVRLSPEEIGTRRARSGSVGTHEDAGRLDRGRRHQGLLRHPRSSTSQRHPRPQGSGRSPPTRDQQVAACGRAGVRGTFLPGRRHTAGRRRVTDPGERLPPRGA